MSLRVRVVALIGMVLPISIVMGTLVAGFQAKQALHAELSSGLLGARQTAMSDFEDLPNSDHQTRDLHQLISTFDGNRHVRAVLIDAEGRAVQSSRTEAANPGAPDWFMRLLGPTPPDMEIRVPEDIRGFSAIRLVPTPAIDVGDAWDEFSGVVAVLAGSALVGLLLVYVVIEAAFTPLRALSTEFAKIGTGDYSGRVAEKGPNELLNLQRGFNEMASQLSATTDRNRLLTDQLLTIQDEERADIARDLHDEIGPHLFGVNMDAEMAIKHIDGGRHDRAPEHLRSIQIAVGHMQRQVRDLLGRLRPTRVTEFGLNAALTDLLKFWAARRPGIVFDLKGPDEEDALPEAMREAVYRIVQEAANNAVKHGDPKTIQICVELQNDSDLGVMVFDDGLESANRPKAGGLGLVGMRERVMALGGSLTYGKIAGGPGWSVVARLPVPSNTGVSPYGVAVS
jgi:two-component system sensor histidine kinase UhpB